MKTLTVQTALLLLCLLASACASTQTQVSWLENSPKIDEENGRK